MRAKVGNWARGFAALAAAGAAVVLLGAGAANASASSSVHAVHVSAGQVSVAAQADEGTWS
jgi:hypothetical protein